jgi:hypothetical protein
MWLCKIFVLPLSGPADTIADGDVLIAAGQILRKTVYCPADITYYDLHLI